MPQLPPLCAKLHHCLHTIQPEAEYEFQLIFAQIPLELNRSLRKKTEQATTILVNKIFTYIHENISQNIPLTDLAAHFGISKSYILKLFRRIFKTTVTTYINGVKLDHAAQLLRTSMMNVIEISDFLGYSDSAYFSRIFQKRFGQCSTKFN